jgi:hypothetical protein
MKNEIKQSLVFGDNTGPDAILHIESHEFESGEVDHLILEDGQMQVMLYREDNRWKLSIWPTHLNVDGICHSIFLDKPTEAVK